MQSHRHPTEPAPTTVIFPELGEFDLEWQSDGSMSSVGTQEDGTFNVSARGLSDGEKEVSENISLRIDSLATVVDLPALQVSAKKTCSLVVAYVGSGTCPDGENLYFRSRVNLPKYAHCLGAIVWPLHQSAAPASNVSNPGWATCR